MKLLAFTIVLDGMPWIPLHLPMFNRTSVDWEWHVIEGVANPKHCTSWCRPIIPRLSNDGTTQYLGSIESNPRVHVYRKPEWDGKLEMVNVAAARVSSPGTVLMQIDADEVWQHWQIDSICSMFDEDRSRNCAAFRCRYFVGQNLVTMGRNCYGDKSYEWYRAWRVDPGCSFSRHEPPVIQGQQVKEFSKDETESAGLVFDHYAYSTRAKVAFKEVFYGYTGAVEQWERLQSNTRWPARLRSFLPWVKDDCMVTTLHKPQTLKSA